LNVRLLNRFSVDDLIDYFNSGCVKFEIFTYTIVSLYSTRYLDPDLLPI